MLSYTEELLRRQGILPTEHHRFCKYPCYCMIGPGTSAQQAYLENIRRIMTTAVAGMVAHGFDQYGHPVSERLLTPDEIAEEYGRLLALGRNGLAQGGEYGLLAPRTLE